MNNLVQETTLFFGLNVVFFCMEMKFIIFGDFKIIVGEFGPVEEELLITLILALIGYVTPEFF